MVHPNGTLIYAFVVESDEGTFVCNGTNSLGFVVSDEVTLLTACEYPMTISSLLLMQRVVLTISITSPFSFLT